MSFFDTSKISMAMGILPSSAEFKIVERALEISRQQAMLRKANYICFPRSSDNARYTAFGSGKVNFNFANARATGFNSTGAAQNYDLEGSIDRIRSLLVFFSDADSIIYLDGKELCNDHALWHLFTDIDVTQLDVLLPASKIPNQFAIAMFASDKPNHSYQNSLFVSHDVQTSTVTSATAVSQVSMLRHIAGYDTSILTTRNTDTGDGISLTVEYSADGITWYAVSGYNPKAVAAGVIDELDITVKYHFIRASVVRSGAGDATMTQILQCSR